LAPFDTALAPFGAAFGATADLLLEALDIGLVKASSKDR
jgi:hypothetical protein